VGRCGDVAGTATATTGAMARRQQLGQLHAQGILSDEFAQAKAQILGCRRPR
jgi:hypothetical protein